MNCGERYYHFWFRGWVDENNPGVWRNSNLKTKSEKEHGCRSLNVNIFPTSNDSTKIRSIRIHLTPKSNSKCHESNQWANRSTHETTNFTTRQLTPRPPKIVVFERCCELYSAMALFKWILMTKEREVFVESFSYRHVWSQSSVVIRIKKFFHPFFLENKWTNPSNLSGKPHPSFFPPHKFNFDPLDLLWVMTQARFCCEGVSCSQMSEMRQHCGFFSRLE